MSAPKAADHQAFQLQAARALLEAARSCIQAKRERERSKPPEPAAERRP